MNAETPAAPFAPLAPPDASNLFDARRQRLECVGRTRRGRDVVSFAFRPEGGGWFRYEAGQFVTLELPLADGPIHRTYTLSSSPSRPFTVEVTVKAGTASRASRWMIDNLRPGMRLQAAGPAGRFTLSAAGPGAARLLFLSAGSGATPMMSMLRFLADVAPDADVAYIHVARTPADILFRRELELIAETMPNLVLGFLVSRRDGEGADEAAGRVWPGLAGRLDAARLGLLAPDLTARTAFCCGPAGFMSAARDLLVSLGLPPERYHEESFGSLPDADGPIAAEAPLAAADAPQGAPIRFTLSNRETRAAPGQTVLQAARSAGVRISAACESGLCGTCRVACEGPVEMSHNGGILEEEVAEGFILACCSRPTGPISVEA